MAVLTTNFLIITGNSKTNKTVTFPDGILGITIQNVGDSDATITFNDGSTVPVRRNGGTFSLDTSSMMYKGFSVAATTTTIDYVVIGVKPTDIVIA